MVKRFLSLLLISSSILLMSVYSLAQTTFVCTGAPSPRLIVGQQGRVLPGDANNVRDAASRSGTRIGAIDGGVIFNILEGPVCADGLVWWRVESNGLLGWTVEGAENEYWIEPYSPPTQTPTPAPTNTPSPTATPRPVVNFTVSYPMINQLAVGGQARIINDSSFLTPPQLLLRAAPSQSADILARLDDGEILTIVGGAQEAESLRWWEVRTATGQRGWVIEGLQAHPQGDYERSLLPLCPATGERIAFRLTNYLYTANPDGSDLCINEHLNWSALYTSSDYSVDMWNVFRFAPNGSELAYINGNNSLFLENQTTQQVRKIFAEGTKTLWYDWSPDSQRLLTTNLVGDTLTSQIWTMKTDGTLIAALTQGQNTKSWAYWLDDSETILYVEEIGEFPTLGQIYRPRTYVFYTVNLLRGGLREIYRTTEDVQSVSLSPDRTRIALHGYQWQDEEPKSSDLRVLNAYTGEMLLTTRAFHGTDWTENGQALYQFDDTSPSLSFLDLSTGEVSSTVPYIGQLPDFISSFADADFLYLLTQTKLYRMAMMTGEIQLLLEQD